MRISNIAILTLWLLVSSLSRGFCQKASGQQTPLPIDIGNQFFEVEYYNPYARFYYSDYDLNASLDSFALKHDSRLFDTSEKIDSQKDQATSAKSDTYEFSPMLFYSVYWHKYSGGELLVEPTRDGFEQFWQEFLEIPERNFSEKIAFLNQEMKSLYGTDLALPAPPKVSATDMVLRTKLDDSESELARIESRLDQLYNERSHLLRKRTSIRRSFDVGRCEDISSESVVYEHLVSPKKFIMAGETEASAFQMALKEARGIYQGLLETNLSELAESASKYFMRNRTILSSVRGKESASTDRLQFISKKDKKSTGDQLEILSLKKTQTEASRSEAVLCGRVQTAKAIISALHERQQNQQKLESFLRFGSLRETVKEYASKYRKIAELKQKRKETENLSLEQFRPSESSSKRDRKKLKKQLINKLDDDISRLEEQLTPSNGLLSLGDNGGPSLSEQIIRFQKLGVIAEGQALLSYVNEKTRENDSEFLSSFKIPQRFIDEEIKSEIERALLERLKIDQFLKSSIGEITSTGGSPYYFSGLIRDEFFNPVFSKSVQKSSSGQRPGIFQRLMLSYGHFEVDAFTNVDQLEQDYANIRGKLTAMATKKEYAIRIEKKFSAADRTYQRASGEVAKERARLALSCWKTVFHGNYGDQNLQFLNADIEAADPDCFEELLPYKDDRTDRLERIDGAQKYLDIADATRAWQDRQNEIKRKLSSLGFVNDTGLKRAAEIRKEIEEISKQTVLSKAASNKQEALVRFYCDFFGTLPPQSYYQAFSPKGTGCSREAAWAENVISRTEIQDFLGFARRAYADEGEQQVSDTSEQEDARNDSLAQAKELETYLEKDTCFKTLYNNFYELSLNAEVQNLLEEVSENNNLERSFLRLEFKREGPLELLQKTGQRMSVPKANVYFFMLKKNAPTRSLYRLAKELEEELQGEFQKLAEMADKKDESFSLEKFETVVKDYIAQKDRGPYLERLLASTRAEFNTFLSKRDRFYESFFSHYDKEGLPVFTARTFDKRLVRAVARRLSEIGGTVGSGPVGEAAAALDRYIGHSRISAIDSKAKIPFISPPIQLAGISVVGVNASNQAVEQDYLLSLSLREETRSGLPCVDSNDFDKLIRLSKPDVFIKEFQRLYRKNGPINDD